MTSFHQKKAELEADREKEFGTLNGSLTSLRSVRKHHDAQQKSTAKYQDGPSQKDALASAAKASSSEARAQKEQQRREKERTIERAEKKFLAEERKRREEVARAQRELVPRPPADGYDSRSALEWLVSCGFSPNDLHGERCMDGWTWRTPVAHATFTGNVPMLEWLLAQGCEEDISRLGRYGWTPFALACQQGHLECAVWLYEHNPFAEEHLRLPSDAGWSPMRAACQEGHLHVAVWLILNGALNKVEDARSEMGAHEATGRRVGKQVGSFVAGKHGSMVVATAGANVGKGIDLTNKALSSGCNIAGDFTKTQIFTTSNAIKGARLKVGGKDSPAGGEGTIMQDGDNKQDDDGRLVDIDLVRKETRPACTCVYDFTI